MIPHYRGLSFILFFSWKKMFLMLLYYLLTLKHYFQCKSRQGKPLKYVLKSANYSVIILML